MKYQYQGIEFINDPGEIDSYYASINKVMRKTPSSYNILIKQEDWIAVCADENFQTDLFTAILTTIQEGGYTELQSVSWDLLEPMVMKIQATNQGLQNFFHHSIGWTILFAGNPDWMILFPHPDSFWLVVGKPEFVRKILGCNVEGAFNSIQEKVDAYQLLNNREYKYFSYLLHQLREVYSVAQVGEEVGFDLP